MKIRSRFKIISCISDSVKSLLKTEMELVIDFQQKFFKKQEEINRLFDTSVVSRQKIVFRTFLISIVAFEVN